MAEFPEHLTPERHRDADELVELAARRTLFIALTALAVAALAGFLGQEPERSTASAPRATLEVSAPDRLRGGLFFQGRFEVEAREAIEDTVLVLAPGWLESMSVNTIEPAPVEESGRDGHVALAFGPVEAGERLVVYMQFQVNPTNVGRRSAGVELRDGAELLARTERTVTIFP